MEIEVQKILCLFIGYAFGCILTAEIVTRAKGLDVRYIDPTVKEGKGNPGMANVMINVGFKSGVVVFIGDALKTVVAMVLSYILFKEGLGKLALLYSGFGTILGHNFPFWRKFSGGKGVLTTIIWFVIVMPVYSWISLLISAVFVCVSGYLNLTAIIMTLIAIPLAFLTETIEFGIFMILASALMIIRNRRDLIQTFNGSYHRVYPLQRLLKKKKQ